jgi:predicted nucleic-acid-binding protein
MIAVDTNVVVRLLVNDNAAQAAKARALFAAGHDIHISPTVLLEAEWVLRAAYRCQAPDIASFLRALLGLPGVQTLMPQRVAWALDAYERGMDFADALHVLLSEEAAVFYTFDANLRKLAPRLIDVVQVAAP